MIIDKKLFTLTQLETLKPILEFESELCLVDIIKNKQIVYKDKDPTSHFYFVINYEDFVAQKNEIYIEYTPASEDNLTAKVTRVKADQILIYVHHWLSLIEKYNEIEIGKTGLIDDYIKDYYDEFILTDDPSNDKPLKIQQALLLDEYLKTIENKIDDFVNEENQGEIDEIKSDIIAFRNTITNIKKSEVVKKLSVISAKMTKAGLAFIKEFLSEAKKEGIKRVLGWVMENGIDGIDGVVKQLTSHH